MHHSEDKRIWLTLKKVGDAETDIASMPIPLTLFRWGSWGENFEQFQAGCAVQAKADSHHRTGIKEGIRSKNPRFVRIPAAKNWLDGDIIRFWRFELRAMRICIRVMAFPPVELSSNMIDPNPQCFLHRVAFRRKQAFGCGKGLVVFKLFQNSWDFDYFIQQVL